MSAPNLAMRLPFDERPPAYQPNVPEQTPRGDAAATTSEELTSPPPRGGHSDSVSVRSPLSGDVHPHKPSALEGRDHTPDPRPLGHENRGQPGETGNRHSGLILEIEQIEAALEEIGTDGLEVSVALAAIKRGEDGRAALRHAAGVLANAAEVLRRRAVHLEKTVRRLGP